MPGKGVAGNQSIQAGMSTGANAVKLSSGSGF